MDINQINCIKYVLRSPTLLVTICHFAHSDRYLEVRERALGLLHLGGKILVGKDIVKKWLGAKLDNSSDEGGFGIVMKGLEESIFP